MDEVLLRLEGAWIGYGGRAVVRAASLPLRRQEFVVIAGPNGSGKTTLLRALAGLQPLLGGTLRMHAGARVGYVPQRERIDPLVPLRAEHVAALGLYGELRPWQLAGRPERARVHEALVRCHAADLARRPWRVLSAGQRQRVLIARALVARPDVLLLDEPTAGLDPATELEIVAMLDDLRDREGMAICMVTHQLEPLVGRATRVLRVEKGEVTSETRAA
ncbi:MAG TPA: ATP-binding cassette domain-containing protein [Myxococcota bacterium]|jgi:ABC-type Mn2+/Zn2+ transport system ATPase subunit|nr:ATP-binding cassette domain-containing protein [Myxococcota bacterium]